MSIYLSNKAEGCCYTFCILTNQLPNSFGVVYKKKFKSLFHFMEIKNEISRGVFFKRNHTQAIWEREFGLKKEFETFLFLIERISSNKGHRNL